MKNPNNALSFQIERGLNFKWELMHVWEQAYSQQAAKNSISNCPLCAIGQDSNKSKIWKLTEMDADHVAAWSKGGATNTKNCQMLCKTHNRAKGNRWFKRL